MRLEVAQSEPSHGAITTTVLEGKGDIDGAPMSCRLLMLWTAPTLGHRGAI